VADMLTDSAIHVALVHGSVKPRETVKLWHDSAIARLPLGAGMLGRVVNALAMPVDGRGAIPQCLFDISECPAGAGAPPGTPPADADGRTGGNSVAMRGSGHQPVFAWDSPGIAQRARATSMFATGALVVAWRGCAPPTNPPCAAAAGSAGHRLNTPPFVPLSHIPHRLPRRPPVICLPFPSVVTAPSRHATPHGTHTASPPPAAASRHAITPSPPPCPSSPS
jgi:hypothetical protein